MRTALATVAISLAFAIYVSAGLAQENEPNRRPSTLDRFFQIRGVEWSESQKSAIAEMKKQFAPNLLDLQRRQNAIFGQEQRRERQAAFRAARESGKSASEARDAAEQAAKLSETQRKRLSQLRNEQTELRAKLQSQLRGLLTAEQRAQAQGRNTNRNAQRPNAQRRLRPTHADVKYGPHARNVMDIWIAPSKRPTAMLVSIHGGGFRGGNKGIDPGLLQSCLASGISVAAITYRLSGEAIAPAQFHDSARAIQFIRHNAKKWNIDKSRFAATGGSAGAGISLWLGFHDEMADPQNEDAVLRESTKLSCMAVYNGQTSYDPRFIRDLFPGTDTYLHPALPQLFGVKFDDLEGLPADKLKLFEQVSALPHLDKADPSALLMYASSMDAKITSQGIGIHHPRFGKTLKERMDRLGLECRVETGVRRGNPAFAAMTMRFLKRHSSLPPKIEEGVSYGRTEDGEVHLDLATPPGEGPFPAIVFIHGGGWFQGSRIGYRKQIEEAARRGYVAASISYRLMKFDMQKKETTSAKPIFPAQIHDAKAAIRWVRGNAKKLKVDPNRIGVTGGSAGGHLSLLVGLADSGANLEGESGSPGVSSRVQAVVNVFGPADMAACHRTSSVAWIFRLFLGGDPDGRPAIYEAASPLHYASKDDPPVLTLQGDKDLLVPLAQAKLLDDAMRRAGADHQLMVFEGQGHGFLGKARQESLDAMWAFFDKHLAIQPR